MAWQLPLVQTVYRRKATAIAIAHSSSKYRISAHDTYSCENIAFWLWKQAGYILLKWSTSHSNQNRSNKNHCALVRLSDRYWTEWAWLQHFNAWCNWVLLLSCDTVLKFDWYCWLSGSRSNSLNSWKLPDPFSFGLGRYTRVKKQYNYPTTHSATWIATVDSWWVLEEVV